MSRIRGLPLHAPVAGEPTADAPAGAGACIGDHCITCSDEAVEMRVLALEGGGLARCAPIAGGAASALGAEQSVETLLVEPLAPGDRVLVHAGVALALVGREPTNVEPTAPEEAAP